MADAPYKGLTIRFGADTTEFTSRMSALNKVIGSTQSKLNALNKAMRGNPESIELLRQNFSLLREQATNAALKVDTLRKAIAEMRAAGIEQMAAGVKNAALEWQRADYQVRSVNKKLNEQYARLAEIGREVGVAFDKDKLDRFYADIEKSEKASASLKLEVRQVAEQVRVLKNEHEKWNAERERAQKIKDFQTAKQNLAIAEAELDRFAKGIVEAREKMASFTEYGQKLDRLGGEFRELKNDSQALTSELASLKTALSRNRDNADAYNRAVEVMAERIRNAARTVKNLEEQLKLTSGRTGVEHVSESMVELKRNVDDARAKTVQAERALAEYKMGVDAAKQSWDSLPRQLRTVLSATDELTDNTRAWMGVTKEQEAEYRKLKATIDGAAEKEKELAQAAARAGDELTMRKALVAQKQVETNLSKEISQFTALTTKVKAFGAAAMNSMRDFATGLGATLGPAVLMLGMHIVNAGDQIDAAFRDMKKTVDGTAEDFENLRKSAVEFSRVHPVSADTILEVESLGGQLGIAVDKLEKFGEVVSNIDIATNLDAETAATQLGQLNSILHWNTMQFDDGREGMERYGDALVRLGNNFATQENKISSITMAIASTGTVMGMTTPEILGWATAIAATGQGAESAGTAISNTMIDIEAAVGSGGDALVAFAEVANMSAEDFAEEWKSAPSDAMYHFVEGLKELSDSGESATMKLDELEIRGVRQVRALLSLGETIDIVQDAQLQANDAWEHGGDASREAAQKAEGFSGKLQMLKNTAQTMGDAFATKLVPLMDKLLELLRGAAKVVDDMDEGVATAITVFGGLAIALGPVLRMISQTTITTEMFKKSLLEAKLAQDALTASEVENVAIGKKVAAANATSTNGLKGMASSLGSAKIAAIALAVAGIAVLAQAIYTYVKEQEKFRKATTEMADALYATEDAAKSNADAFDRGGTAYESCANQARKLIDEHAKLYDEMKQSMTDAKASVKVMERYAEVMRENDGVAKDNLVGAQKLRDAVEKLNGEYNLGLEIKEEDNRLYVVGKEGAENQAEAIETLLDAKRREIELNAIASLQEELIKQQIKDQDALTEAKLQTAIAQEEFDKALEEGDEFVQEYSKNLQDAKKREEEIQKACDGTEASLKALDAKYAITSEAVDDHGRRVKELADEFPGLAQQLGQISDHELGYFMDALDDSGYSVESLRKLSASEISTMVANWKTGTGAWRHDMDVATDRMAQDARTLDSEAEAAFEKMRKETIAKIANMTGVSVQELEKMADAAGVDSELAMKNWVAGIEKAVPDSKNAAGQNAAIVQSELQKAVDSAKTIGENVSAGLAAGIGQTAWMVVNAAASAASAAMTTIEETTKVGSPSKITTWVGRMIDQGLVVGMKKDERAVEKQADIVAGLALGVDAAGRSASMGYLAGRAATTMASTTNSYDNRTANEYVNITLNVEARDLQDVRTIDDLVAMARRAKAQYA